MEGARALRHLSEIPEALPAKVDALLMRAPMAPARDLPSTIVDLTSAPPRWCTPGCNP